MTRQYQKGMFVLIKMFYYGENTGTLTNFYAHGFIHPPPHMISLMCFKVIIFYIVIFTFLTYFFKVYVFCHLCGRQDRSKLGENSLTIKKACKTIYVLFFRI